MLFCAMMLSTGVFWGVGETVLMELNASPSRPLPLPCDSRKYVYNVWI